MVWKKVGIVLLTKEVGIVLLTIVFVGLYVAGFVGWPSFATNKEVVEPIGPIVAVIIGYYFGRLPAAKNEQSLQQQVNQRTQEAEQARAAHQAAQSASDKALAKLDAAKAALSSAAPRSAPHELSATLSDPAGQDAAALRGAVVSTLKVLES